MPATVILLIALTVIMAVVGVYRWIVSHREDEYIHIDDDPSGEMIKNQREAASTLYKIDRLGIILTVLTAVYGVVLAVLYLYQGLNYRPAA
jgi:steroid 5-alpha reductase family enzyme